MSLQKIQSVYTETRGALNSIHRKRKIASFFQKLMWLSLGLYFLGIIVILSNNLLSLELGFLTDLMRKFESTPENPYVQYYPFIGLFVLIFISTSFFPYFFRKFKTLEMATISKMVRSLFPKSEFTQVTQLEINQVKESTLFSWLKADSSIFTFGQMRTIIDGVKIQFADIGVVEPNVGNKIVNFLLNIPFFNMIVILYQYVLKNIFTSKSADNVYYTFRGMYCWTSFKTPVKGNTVIIPNNFTSKADRIASFNFKSEEKILLEDARFTDYFTTYSSDQVEARFILTSSMMEKIVELRTQFNRDIMISFLNNQMFVAVENPNGIFSFPSGKLDSIKIIEELFKEISTVEGIVEGFDLKRRKN